LCFIFDAALREKYKKRQKKSYNEGDIMKNILLVFLFVGALVFAGCSNQQQSPVTTPGNTPATTVTQETASTKITEPPVAKTVDCAELITAEDIGAICTSKGTITGLKPFDQTQVDAASKGRWDATAGAMVTPICVKGYNSVGVYGTIRIVLFNKGDQANSMNKCGVSGGEEVSGIPSGKACAFKDGSEISVEKGNYFVYVGPVQSTSTPACNGDEAIALGKLIAQRLP